MKFDESVYALCKRIPNGKVSTYKDIAEALGSKAYRAVGMALNRNKDWPKVPCHRVVGSDGRLTGFARGIEEKKRLLEKEGIEIKDGKIKDIENKKFRF